MDRGERIDKDYLFNYIISDDEDSKMMVRETLKFMDEQPVMKIRGTENMSHEEFRKLTHDRVLKFLSMEQTDLYRLFSSLKGCFATSEIVGSHDTSFSVKMGVTTFLFSGAVMLLGTQQHIDKYIPLANDSKITGSFAMTERGHGSNVRYIETTAVYDKESQEFIINTPTESAEKMWIGNAMNCHYSAVFAQLIIDGKSEGPHCFVVPIRPIGAPPGPDTTLPGITTTDMGRKSGLNGVDNGWIRFDNVRVPRENLLNRLAEVSADGVYSSAYKNPTQRFNAVLAALTPTRVTVVCSGIGAMRTALYIAIKYSEQRRQFGPSQKPEMPIMDFTTHKTRLIPLLARSYGISFTRVYIADKWINMTPSTKREVEAVIAGLKAYATWTLNETLQTARECVGGVGFHAVNRIGILRQDLDIYCTFEGDNTVLLQQVAKDLVAQFAKEMARGGMFTGMLSFLGSQIWHKVKENVPSVFHSSSAAYFRTPEFQRDALSYREGKLLETVSLRLMHKVRRLKMDPFHAWNDCLDHLTQLSRCHIERVILEQFHDAVEHCAHPGTKRVLKDLCDLYALSTLQSCSSWFLEHGYFASGDARRVRENVLELCNKLRPHLTDLVDAFHLPRVCVDVPILDNVHSWSSARAKM